MSGEKKDRLGAAKVAAATAADALRAALPAPGPTRTERLILALLPDEKARLLAYAADAGEPPAVAARNLILAALTTLGK